MVPLYDYTSDCIHTHTSHSRIWIKCEWNQVVCKQKLASRQ